MKHQEVRLYMVLLGCTPQGRLIEQHDIFFGIGSSLKELKPEMYNTWPDGGQLHIDSWREVTQVDGYTVSIVPKEGKTQTEKLFFINLGGYKPGDLEEYHYKMLIVAESMSIAIKTAKQTAFYKHVGFPGAVSHIDDKYGIDVDDVYNVEDILPAVFKETYTLKITKATELKEDKLNIGYLKLGARF